MIIIGVDSHSQSHLAYSVTESGRPIKSLQVKNHPSGYRKLLEWAKAQDQEEQRLWGIENSGSYGRLLAQYLVKEGERVYEVNPQLTSRRRRSQSQSARSKSDEHDALAIARVVVMEGQEHLPCVVAEDQSDLCCGFWWNSEITWLQPAPEPLIKGMDNCARLCLSIRSTA